MIVATVATVALAAVLFSASSLYDVVDKGKGPPIVPYEGGGVVYKVRVLDLFNVYADEESRPAPDKLSSVGLVAAASMSLMTLLLLTAAGAGARRRRFYAFATAGLALLATDELFAFHETLGHNLRFLADLPGVERPDDLVFAGYLIPLAIFAWSFRDLLRAQRKAVQLFAVGTCFFAISVAADLAGVSLDEPAEGVAAICLLAGLVILTAATLREELALSGSQSSPVGPSAEQTYRPPVLTEAGFDTLAALTAARQRSRRTAPRLVRADPAGGKPVLSYVTGDVGETQPSSGRRTAQPMMRMAPGLKRVTAAAIRQSYFRVGREALARQSRAWVALL